MATVAQEATERGRAARGQSPRGAHADWKPAADRADPISILEEQAKTRIPELVKIRYGRMLRSPFTFFRGGAAIMAADLAGTPTSGVRAQLCGDAHLLNFGVFAAPDGGLIFDLNDFDETLPGPWEWDLKRLAVSFAVAGRDRKFSAKKRAEAITATLRSYRRAIHKFADMRTIDVWYARLNVADQFDTWDELDPGTSRKDFDKAVTTARSKDSLRAFSHLAHKVDGRPRIVSDPPLVVPLAELLTDEDQAVFYAGVDRLLESYRRTLQADRKLLVDGYTPVDAARKVVGVGSVGTRAWIVLFVGKDEADPLFLQIKQAGHSVLEPYVGRSRFDSCGRRVVEGQRLMQAASDALLGWMHADEQFRQGQGHYYVRQLWNAKLSAKVEEMTPRGLAVYGEVCGWTLARAHARTGDRAAIAGYLGGSDRFDEAVAEFAELYADQNERDHAALQAAVDSGRILARTDV